jgi:putative sterol carrier protein
MNLTFEDAVERVKAKLTPETKARLHSVIGFTLKDSGEHYTLDAQDADGKGWLEGSPQEHGLDAPFAVTLTRDDFAKLIAGELNPMKGMVTGRMRLKGDIKGALRLDALLKG